MTTAQIDVTALVRVEGGIADEGMLDMYDAASMIHGLARGLNLVAHSFANNEEIRVRASGARDVQTFIHSSKKGCFEEQVDIRFSKKIVDKMGHSVITNNFWDYLAYAWSAAIGQNTDPTSSHLQKVVKRDQDFMYDIGDALESAMLDIHKPICRDKNQTIVLARPRVGDILELNNKTMHFITTRTELDKVVDLTGNVTRYNILSDFGRFYSDADGRVISFKLAKPDDKDVKKKVVQSMQDHLNGARGLLKFRASPVVNSQGLIKRYIVHDVVKV